jgi:hypothetical protein
LFLPERMNPRRWQSDFGENRQGQVQILLVIPCSVWHPGTSLKTKGDGIEFQTPSIEGTISRRNKLDAQNKHPWKAEVTDGEEGVSPNVISNWFQSVYEPD